MRNVRWVLGSRLNEQCRYTRLATSEHQVSCISTHQKQPNTIGICRHIGAVEAVIPLEQVVDLCARRRGMGNRSVSACCVVRHYGGRYPQCRAILSPFHLLECHKETHPV